jgi:copper chaperone CopZ
MNLRFSLRIPILILTGLLMAAEPLHAEYLKIQLRVYGLDCGLCARGVAASVERLDGVKTVGVNVKTGLLEIELTPGNTFKMARLRKVIRENGFRSMEATVTAVGAFNASSKFEVTGSGEAYDVAQGPGKDRGPVQLTFKIQ